MWLVRFLHVIPPYNVIRAPVDIYKTVIGTWRLEWFHFTFVDGGRWEASKGRVGKVQGAGIWSGPWGMRRVFLGWEDGKAIAGIGSSMVKSRRCGNKCSHGWWAWWMWCTQYNAVGAMGDEADTRTQKSGPKCESPTWAWRAVSLTHVHLNFQVHFQATPVTSDRICLPPLIWRLVGILAVVSLRLGRRLRTDEVFQQEPIRLYSSAGGLLQALVGVLVALLLHVEQYWWRLKPV